MALWLTKLRARLRGHRLEEHKIEVRIELPQGASKEEADAVVREVMAELGTPDDPAVEQSNLESIAERHGGKLDQFDES
jgi:hypothetical protein